ncbi:MAG: hypothetical protein U0234_09135 [Sandaracinus sp.]
MTRACLLLASLAALVACGSSPPPPSSSPPPPPTSEAPPTSVAAPAPTLGGRVVDGLFVPEGFASAPRACTADADCTCNTEPDPAEPCCQLPTTLSCYRQDYGSALGAARASACAAVRCPPPPPPSLPEACRLTGRCDAGRCTDACNAPSLPPAPPS